MEQSAWRVDAKDVSGSGLRREAERENSLCPLGRRFDGQQEEIAYCQNPPRGLDARITCSPSRLSGGRRCG